MNKRKRKAYTYIGVGLTFILLGVFIFKVWPPLLFTSLIIGVVASFIGAGMLTRR